MNGLQISLWVVLSTFVAIVAEFSADTYRCTVCTSTVDIMKNSPSSSFATACRGFFNDEICDDIVFASVSSAMATTETSREFCRLIHLCPAEHDAFKSTAPQTLDFRVSKAVGSRGYDKVRVSVVSNQTIDSPYLTYSKQFQYRWTDKFLSTGIVTVPVGEKKTINIAGNDIDLFIPNPSDGVRGVIIGDPCFQSEWIVCLYKNALQTFNHTIELINAMSSHDDFHYYQILGDNFYDQEGAATASWFEALSMQSKSKFFATVPGKYRNIPLWPY
jgi:hypothetical protein